MTILKDMSALEINKYFPNSMHFKAPLRRNLFANFANKVIPVTQIDNIILQYSVQTGKWTCVQVCWYP